MQGTSRGGGDAANLLKPALARGELKTIAATTWPEYKKYFEKDPALSRRFQLVQLHEPSIAQAQIILRGLKGAYEKTHNVYITDAALEAAARLSARFITGRYLPDKAIDVLDTACARVRAGQGDNPEELKELESEKAQLLREHEALHRDQLSGQESEDMQARLVEIDTQLKALETEKAPLMQAFQEQRQLAESYIALRDRALGKTEENNKEEKVEGETKVGAEVDEDDGLFLPPTTPLDLTQARTAFTTAREAHPLVAVEVGPEEIAEVIADWTGIPAASMEDDEMERLLHLADTVQKVIKGQDHAIKAIEVRLQTARLDLHRAGQPLGVFLLAGPSGVGKTETALELARQLFGGERFVTTINMSEYQERHTLSRLIGSPPGYVGYGEGGVLTEAIRKKPYSVVLLDEVEKADPNVMNLFYQAFDKGEMADGEGRIIDCKNVVFVLTSNLGSQQIVEMADQAHREHIAAGGEDDGMADDVPERMVKALHPIFADHFRPALMARMQLIAYLPLSKSVLNEIITMKLDQLAEKLLSTRKIELQVDESARGYLQKLCDFSANGARQVDQVIQRQVLSTLSLEVLQSGVSGRRVNGLNIGATDDGLTFSFGYAEGTV